LIAVVSCSHYPDDERIYHKEIQTLSEKNHKINYFTFSESDILLSNNNIIHKNYKKSKYSIKEYIKLVENEIKNTKTYVIHIHEPELFSLAINIKKLIGAKIVYDVHEDYISMIYTFSKWNKYIKYVKAAYWMYKEKSFLSYVDEIIIASPTINNSDFKAQGFNPLLLENFPLNNMINNIDITLKRKNSIIYHGNLGPERGITELIYAMPKVIKNIPSIYLSIFGGFRTNAYKREVNNAIDSLGLRNYINLSGHIFHKDIWEHLGENMIGVIPFNDNPLTRINTPTKLFEYMAAGCQLVMPNLPPVRRFDIKGARYFNAGDVNGLAEVIIDAINNFKKEDIIYNQEKVKNLYNWGNNCDKLLKLYERILP